MSGDGAPTISGRLAQILARPISEHDRARAALHLADWIACASAGALEPAGRAMIAYGRTVHDGPCHVVGGRSLGVSDAALINGAVGNILEMDDIHRTALVHPGPVVVPVALALAQDRDLPGHACLDAIVRGYEAAIRVGRSVGQAHYRMFHNTATCGVFGAAAAAGSLLVLGPKAMIDAFGHAGTQASGLWQCRLEGAMSKQLHNGRAAQSGLLSAQLAAVGLSGAAAIFEGELGFFRGLCPDGEPEAVVADSGGDWLIHETSFKPWASCRHTHPTIDAVLVLRDRLLRAGPAASPRRIHVSTYRDAARICDKPSPATEIDAKFSLQHVAAVTLLRGAPTLDDFGAATRADPQIAGLRALVTIAEDEALTRAYPAHFGASVFIDLADGEQLSAVVADALGDSERPLSSHQLHAKLDQLMLAAERPAGTAASLFDAATSLPRAGSVLSVARFLHQASEETP